MSEFADIKSRQLIRVLYKLIKKNTNIELLPGGRHNYKLHCISNGRAFPIPASHEYVNKYIVKDLAEVLQEWGICTIDEFKEFL